MLVLIEEAAPDVVGVCLDTGNPTFAGEDPALTPAQGQALLAAAWGHRHEVLYRVALTLGLRWEDMDRDAGTLRVAQTVRRVDGKLIFGSPKTRRSRRTLPLPDALRWSLADHFARQRTERERAGDAWSECGLVFTTRPGTPLAPRKTARAFKALLAHAGLPDVRFHDLRHPCASLLVAAGHHPRVVMGTLGHSQIGIAMDTYAHVYARALRAVAEAEAPGGVEQPPGSQDIQARR